MTLYGDTLGEFAHVAEVVNTWELTTPELQDFRVSILHYHAHGATIEHFGPRVEIREGLLSGEKWVEHTVSSAAHTEADAFREAMQFIRDWLKESAKG